MPLGSTCTLFLESFAGLAIGGGVLPPAFDAIFLSLIVLGSLYIH